MTFEYEVVTLGNLIALLAARDGAGWTLTTVVPLNANPGELGTGATFLCIFQM